MAKKPEVEVEEGMIAIHRVDDVIRILKSMPNQRAPCFVEVLASNGRSKTIYGHLSVQRAGPHVAIRVVKTDGVKGR